MQASASTGPGAPRPAARLVGQCQMRLWGLSQTERWRRTLRRVGIWQVAEDGGELPESGSVLLVRADYLLDDGSVAALAAGPGRLLAVGAAGGTRLPVAAHVARARAEAVAALLAEPTLQPGDERAAGLEVLAPGELANGHNETLRKRAQPYAVSLRLDGRAAAERHTFAGAYKGVTDAVTKYLWPAPARLVTRWCAELGITPNMVTATSLVFVLLALWRFAAGDFATGLAAAWVMTFLDTVDGKLARVTLTSSRWGNVFDHGIDLIHPPFWYWGWWYGLVAGAGGPAAVAPAAWAVSDLALWVVIAGYVAQRLLEGLFIWAFGMEMHVWRRVDSLFRLVTARRNPNLVILTVATVAGRPDLGFGLVAAWTALCLAFHAVQVVQAWRCKTAGRPPVSWLSAPTRAANG